MLARICNPRVLTHRLQIGASKIFFSILFMFSSCNYIPCRGQDYLIENITQKELYKKLNTLYIEKFEKEILSELNVKWRRQSCW